MRILIGVQCGISSTDTKWKFSRYFYVSDKPIVSLLIVSIPALGIIGNDIEPLRRHLTAWQVNEWF